jgi:hypothetical protein
MAKTKGIRILLPRIRITTMAKVIIKNAAIFLIFVIWYFTNYRCGKKDNSLNAKLHNFYLYRP